MGRRKSWQHRDENLAWCDRCGGRSEYRFMPGWYSLRRIQGRDYTYWRWWKGFKRAHNRCGVNDAPET